MSAPALTIAHTEELAREWWIDAWSDHELDAIIALHAPGRGAHTAS